MTGIPIPRHTSARRAVNWAWSWITWPAAARQLRRQGWHRIGFATWEAPSPGTMRLRP